MRWSELTIQADGSAEWTIPGDRTKNGRSHLVATGADGRGAPPGPARRGGGARARSCFGGGKGGTHKAWAEQRATKHHKPIKHGEDNFSAWSRSKVRLDGRIAKTRGGDGKPAPLPGWVLHDLRRTFATGTNNMGVEPHVVEAAIIM